MFFQKCVDSLFYKKMLRLNSNNLEFKDMDLKSQNNLTEDMDMDMKLVLSESEDEESEPKKTQPSITANGNFNQISI